MAKLCALFVLAFVCVVRGVRIDSPSLVRPGKYFAEDLVPRTTPNDPRCSKGNGLYAHPSDCTRYFACSDGMSQERGCPEGFKFDSLRHCTPNEDADCGRRQIRAESAEAVICPSYYGYFPYAEDCHKFVVCVEGLPTVHNCPEGQHYDDNVGCVDGAVCPQIQAEESTVCRKADSLYPHDNCLRYYKCVNFKPQSKGCSRGKAFDPKKSACKREQFSKCKRNDVQDIMRSDY